jgi:succinate dehydrogenase / fumarate reductase flavoprotein subunit
LGNIIWNNVGMSRDKSSLEKTLQTIPELKEKFWSEVNIPGKSNQLNSELEKAGRLADFIELGELMAKDALNREESCGGHFREEHQTEENEAKRNDKDYAYVSSWEHTAKGSKLHKEKLTFENVKLTTRSYK